MEIWITERNKEFEVINADYISNEKLSKEDIDNLIVRSENVSERFDEEIANHSLFIETIDSHLENNVNELKRENEELSG